MRFLLCLTIWIVIVGGLWLYTWQRDMARAKVIMTQPEIHYVERDFSLEVTSTFSAEPDPFSLQLDNTPSSPLEISVNGVPLRIDTDVLRRGEVLKIEKVGNLLMGSNELYLKASPPLAESDRDHAIRIRLLQAEDILLDRTIWSKEGSLVSGSVNFKLEDTAGDAHDH